MAKLMDVNPDADRDDDNGGEESAGGEHEEGLENAETEGTEETEVTEEQDENHDEAKNEKLPDKVQKMVDKRIGKLVGRAKTAEERAERAETEAKSLRERVDAEDADIVLTAAKQFGVVAELLPKGAAEGMAKLSQAREAVEQLENILDLEDGNEVTVDGKSYERKEVKKALIAHRTMVKSLEPKFGKFEQQAKDAMLEIFRLGQQAKKAGWKPGQKQETTVPKKVDPAKAKAKETDDPDDEAPPSRVRGREADGGRGAEQPRDRPFSLGGFFAEQEEAKAKRK